MRRDLVIAGISGLLFGAFIFFVAGWIKSHIPSLVSGMIATLVVFAILLLIALFEMPMMVFALRKMAQSVTTPRKVISSGFSLYVTFAAAYAAIFVLITDDHYFFLGTFLAALGLARFASGILIP